MDPVTETPTKLVDYAMISGAYGSLIAGLMVAARRKGEDPLRDADIVPIGIATFALAKLLTKEKVETWVREPFVEEMPGGERKPRGTRMRYAVGELLTCSRCMGAWSGLGITALRVMRPREARIVTTVLGASAVNDFMQTGFSLAASHTTLAEQAEGGEHAPETEAQDAAAPPRGHRSPDAASASA